MQAGKASISQIFDLGRVLEVPFFQRSYVWDVDEWKRFLSDMQQLTQTKEEFFMGAIILKKPKSKDENKRTVVDGQQRLTTLILLLKVLSLINPESKLLFDFLFKTQAEKKSKLKHGYVDYLPFDTIISLEEFKDVHGTNQIIKAYNYFRSNVSSYQLNFSSIVEKVSLVSIDLESDENEQQIFDTINSLGRKLTTGELLKNYIFDSSAIHEYEKIWMPVFEKDEDCMKYWASTITAGRTTRSNTEGFFHAFLQIQMQIPQYNVSAEEKLVFRKTESVFNNYKTFITKYIKDDIIPFVKELASYAAIYKEAFEDDIRYSAIPKTPCIERMNFIVYALDATTLIPYVLYLVKNVADESERNKMFDFLESYIVRRTICKSSNDNYSDLFNEHLIANNILTYEGLRDYIDSKGNTSILMPNDEMVRQAFHSVAPNNNRSRAILFLLESKIRTKGHATTLLPCNSYTLEHLMPKKWKQNWLPLPPDVTEDERNIAVNSLGNMMLLPISLNSSISNSNWETKKNGNGKKKGLIEYASDLEIWNGALQKPEWNEDTISERAEWLAEKANEVWFNECSDEVGVSKGKKLDDTEFSIDGINFYKKSRFIPLLIRRFVEKHPEKTFAQLQLLFPDTLLGTNFRRLGVLVRKDVLDASTKSPQQKQKWYYYNESSYILTSGDGIKFYVNNQWTIDTIQPIIKIAESEGWSIKKLAK